VGTIKPENDKTFRETMQILTAIFGLIWTFFGVASYLIVSAKTGSSLLLMCAFSYFLIGAIYCLAVVNNYKGGWPFLIGGSLIGISMFFLYSQIKWSVENSPKAGWSGVVIIVFFILIGLFF
jgi:hypothetical protein